MHIRKEVKYGYSVETAGKNKLFKPSSLTNIVLTPRNSKFLFYGTKHDILKWMSLHPELLVEYDPLGKDCYESEFTPPPSPLPSEYLSSPTSSTFSTSPSSSILSSSPTSPTSPISPTFSISTISSSRSGATNENQRNIVFDLFANPAKTPSIILEEEAFNKPLNIALKHIPWLEVMLEVRPADEYKDSKLLPIHRVILPSGSSLSKISKVLEKSWKKDQTTSGDNCLNKNYELMQSTRSTNSDNEESLSNKFVAGIAKHVPTFDLWLRQKQTSGPIPPGVLTPYIIDDVLENLGEKKQEEIANEQILKDKKKEAERDKEMLIPDLPKYETVFGDTILERGRG